MDTDYRKVRVWDIWIRLFHWSLVVSVGFLLISGETGWQFFDWHRTAGELVLMLIVFRILWGILGSSNARIQALFQSPVAGLQHLGKLLRRESHSERGHNAAGSWAVLAMLLILTVQAVTGFFIADEDEFLEGALYGTLSNSSTALAYRIHHLNAQLIQIVIAVHVFMVFAYLLYARTNLIGPMITGWMRWPDRQTLPDTHFQKFWPGLLLLAASAGVIGYIAGWF
ncbi:cytochrome b/b6 domain-containing protein [Granulosicoccus sp. 3-233]|uniref:cytochrome b/b6 domain-containing protein n=1 Tax=Granulosicoccus sp. 3-233 TaxID=3417969 RepID=UPI003D347CD6